MRYSLAEVECKVADIVLMDKKMKLFQLVIISVFISTLIIPMANAEIKINSVNIPNVMASSFPNYGSIRFNIVVSHPAGQDELLNVPVIINGTTLSIINVVLRANEVTKIVAANVTIPGATILMVNPFASPRPVPTDLVYSKYPNPYLNPISSVQYELKVGDFTKNATLLVYADWSIWAIVIDIVVVAAAALLVRRFIST
jgi:hypothetical protein